MALTSLPEAKVWSVLRQIVHVTANGTGERDLLDLRVTAVLRLAANLVSKLLHL